MLPAKQDPPREQRGGSETAWIKAWNNLEHILSAPFLQEESSEKSSLPSPQSKKCQISPRRRASWRMAHLYRLAKWRRDNGIALDADRWLFVLASWLSSASPGTFKVNDNGRPARWFGLDSKALKIAADKCGLEVSDKRIDEQISETLAWRRRMRKKLGRDFNAPIGAEKLGEILNVTADERYGAKCYSIMAVDETEVGCFYQRGDLAALSGGGRLQACGERAVQRRGAAEWARRWPLFVRLRRRAARRPVV